MIVVQVPTLGKEIGRSQYYCQAPPTVLRMSLPEMSDCSAYAHSNLKKNRWQTTRRRTDIISKVLEASILTVDHRADPLPYH